VSHKVYGVQVLNPYLYCFRVLKQSRNVRRNIKRAYFFLAKGCA